MSSQVFVFFTILTLIYGSVLGQPVVHSPEIPGPVIGQQPIHSPMNHGSITGQSTVRSPMLHGSSTRQPTVPSGSTTNAYSQMISEPRNGRLTVHSQMTLRSTAVKPTIHSQIISESTIRAPEILESAVGEPSTISSSSAAVAPVPNCSSIESELNPCVGYLLKNESTPSDTCCAGVKTLRQYNRNKAARRAICECLESVAPMFGQIDYSLLSGLPKTCRVSLKLPANISPTFDCSKA